MVKLIKITNIWNTPYSRNKDRDNAIPPCYQVKIKNVLEKRTPGHLSAQVIMRTSRYDAEFLMQVIK